MATHPIPSSNAVCAHDPCSCVVSGMEGTVERDGQTYCSEECARGTGCDHETCDCVHKDKPIAAGR